MKYLIYCVSCGERWRYALAISVEEVRGASLYVWRYLCERKRSQGPSTSKASNQTTCLRPPSTMVYLHCAGGYLIGVRSLLAIRRSLASLLARLRTGFKALPSNCRVFIDPCTMTTLRTAVLVTSHAALTRKFWRCRLLNVGKG